MLPKVRGYAQDILPTAIVIPGHRICLRLCRAEPTSGNLARRWIGSMPAVKMRSPGAFRRVNEHGRVAYLFATRIYDRRSRINSVDSAVVQDLIICPSIIHSVGNSSGSRLPMDCDLFRGAPLSSDLLRNWWPDVLCLRQKPVVTWWVT